MAAKKEISTAIKELKVHKIEKATEGLQKCITLLTTYSNNRYSYQIPAQGGQPKTGPGFTNATTQGGKILSDAISELDFKMVENAIKGVCNVMSLNLPFADNW